MYSAPVLLIAYRRPKTTRRVIDTLREQRPEQVFFSVNAPNPAIKGDESACREVRELVDAIDWDCDLKTNFREFHLSARDSIVFSIDWFFTEVESGIILEDDCVPNRSFFLFAQSMLDHYSDDPDVMHISGANHAPQSLLPDGQSYYFSIYPHIWGWATWRRAWEKYAKSELFDRRAVNQVIDSTVSTEKERSYWLAIFDLTKRRRIDTWDYFWLFTIWSEGGICITPAVNLVSNVGFGGGATNTTSSDSLHSNQATFELPEPLDHPPKELNAEMDQAVCDSLYGITQSQRTGHLKLHVLKFIPIPLKRILKRLLKR